MLPHFGSARPQPAAWMERIERATSVHVLIESAAGVANVDAIAAVDGVDVLHVGLNDLSVDLGASATFGIRTCATRVRG